MAFKKTSTKSTNTKSATKQTENKTEHKAAVIIHGRCTNIYEGKNKNYCSIQVDSQNINPKTNEPFYNVYSVGFDKSIALPLDEGDVIITGELVSYFDKEVQKTQLYINGVAITTDDGTPF